MLKINKTDIREDEFHPYFKRYFDLNADGVDLLQSMSDSKDELIAFFRNDVPKEKLLFRYDQGKWSIKEALQHIIDTERIFMYRCFRASRHDSANMQGFEQDDYINPSGADAKTLDQLLEEYSTTRDAYISLLKSLSAENLAFIGSASDSPVSARAVSFLTIGHQIWHMHIIKERYL